MRVDDLYTIAVLLLAIGLWLLTPWKAIRAAAGRSLGRVAAQILPSALVWGLAALAVALLFGSMGLMIFGVIVVAGIATDISRAFSQRDDY